MENKKNKALYFANIALLCTVIILVLTIFYMWYKSISIQAAPNIKLFSLLIAGLLLSFASLFLRNDLKINIAVVMISTAVAVYCTEAVLFLSHKHFTSKENMDKRSKLEVLEDLRTEGIDAWPQVLAWLFTESNGLMSGQKKRIFPLSGISGKTIVYCNEGGQYKIFKSDEHGFNNPRGLYDSGDVEAVLVGDSFTIGSCVGPGEDIAGQLRKMGLDSLNLGNGGNGPLIELALLEEYARPMRPEIILWIYYEGNDLLDLERERRSQILMSYLEKNYSQNLLERQDEIDSSLINYVNSQWMEEKHIQREILQKGGEERSGGIMVFLDIVKLRRLRSRLGLINAKNQHNPERVTNFKTQLPLFSKVLSSAYQRTSGWNGHFYFVYLPSMERYVNRNDDGDFYDRSDVIAIVHELGIPLIDFHEVLVSHPDPLSLTPFLGAHYNAAGYRLLSELIMSRLKEDGLVSGD